MNNYTFGSVSEGHGPDIDLFSSKPVNSGVLSREYVTYRAKSSISDGAPIDFDVKSGMRYVDMSKSKLCLELEITKANGDPIQDGEFIKFYFEQNKSEEEYEEIETKRSKRDTDTPESTPSETTTTTTTTTTTPTLPSNNQVTTDTDSDVTLIQAILYTLWRQMDIVFQQKCITSGVNIHNAYKSIIDIIIDASKDVKSTYLTTSGYYKDVVSLKSTSLFSNRLNEGLIARNKLTSNGRTASFEGFFIADICQQDRCIINGVDIQFKFYPNTNAFALLTSNTSENFKIKINDIYVKMCMVNLNPAVLVAQSEVLQTKPAIYPYIESQIKSYTVMKGQYSVSIEDMFQSWVPSELIVCFVDSKAYSGDYNSNPFYFKNLNMNYISLSIDGKIIPGNPLQPNFRTDAYQQCYNTLFHNNQLKGSTNGIKYIEYSKGYTIIVFKISDNETPEFVNMKKKGLVRLDIRFASPIEETATLLLYGKFPTVMQIDSVRNVIIQ